MSDSRDKSERRKRDKEEPAEPSESTAGRPAIRLLPIDANYQVSIPGSPPHGVAVYVNETTSLGETNTVSSYSYVRARKVIPLASHLSIVHLHTYDIAHTV